MTYANCCTPGFVVRRYRSRDERIQWLERYAQELEDELKGVKERIEELKP